MRFFSPAPLQGNGLAVVVDTDGISDAQMQQFAARTNLAEITFLLPPADPSADYRVRIFTAPTREILFPGPTQPPATPATSATSLACKLYIGP